MNFLSVLVFPEQGVSSAEEFVFVLVTLAILGLGLLLLRSLVRREFPERDSGPDFGRYKQEREQRRKESLSNSLDAAGWTLLVDGSNFARRGVGGVARMADLDEVLEVLRRRFVGARIKVYCDANLRYCFSEAEEQEEFVQRVELRGDTYRETHGEKADWVLLREAGKGQQCIVVSNDRFREGEEERLRVGVPLLKVRYDWGRVKVDSHVSVHDGGRWVERVPVGVYLRGR